MNNIEIDDFFELEEKNIYEEKDYITRNGKKYYKTKKPYIYKCEDGYYAYRIYHKPSKTNTFVNKHIHTKEKFNTEHKAYQAQQEHILSLEKSATFKYRKVTFGEVWEDFKNNNSRQESTITKYDSIYRHHVSYKFGETPIQDIAYSDINTYLEQMYKEGDERGSKQPGYSYSFTESILKYIWLVYQYAFSKKIISGDDLKLILDHIKMPAQTDERKVRILTTEEIEKVFELLKDTDYFLVFLVSLYTGARPAESFAIRFSDFDYDNMTLNIERQIVEFNGTLSFKDPKTFGRVVPIPKVLAYFAKKRYEEIQTAKRNDPHLFELNRKKVIYSMKLDNRGIDYIFDDMISMDTHGRYNAASSFQYYAKIIRKDICQNNKTHEDFSFYSFRKTAISYMASCNIPIGALKQLTGHKKLDTLYEYYYDIGNDFAQQKISEAVNAMNRLVKIKKE